MSNIYSIMAELIISNAMKDADRSKELSGQLYKEALAISGVVEIILNEAVKLQPKVEKESTSLN